MALAIVQTYMVIIAHICHTFTRLWSVSKRKIKLLPSKWWFSRRYLEVSDGTMSLFHFLLSFFAFFSLFVCCCSVALVAMKSIHAEESFPFPNCLKCARKRNIVCQRLSVCVFVPKNKSYSTRIKWMPSSAQHSDTATKLWKSLLQ